jgi:hypothetical protein
MTQAIGFAIDVWDHAPQETPAAASARKAAKKAA